MLDGHSLEVISRFRQSLLTKSLPNELSSLSVPNRGNKLDQGAAGEKALTPAVVENNGSNRLVLTNKSIEEATLRRKRRWNERYGDDSSVSSEGEETEESDLSNDEESDEDNLLEQIKLTEILAPLNHPSEIVSHPAILKTYTLTIYDKLAAEIIETIETEQNNLNWLNKLLQVLNGEDWFYLLEENLGLLGYDHGLNEDKKGQDNVIAGKTEQVDTTQEKVSEDFSQNNNTEKESSSDEGHKPEQPTNDDRKRITRKTTLSQQEEDSKEIEDPFFALPEALARYIAHQNQVVDDSSDELDILQEYLVNCLQVSIQRQQEYIKNLSGIRNGLVRAERLKEKLFKWGSEMYNKKSN